MRQGTSDLASETACVSSGAMPSRSKVKDFERSVYENKNDTRRGGDAHVFECACNDTDDNVTMSFIHALFSKNIDDDLRTMIEGHS
jgi:hypothetical protein